MRPPKSDMKSNNQGNNDRQCGDRQCDDADDQSYGTKDRTDFCRAGQPVSPGDERGRFALADASKDETEDTGKSQTENSENQNIGLRRSGGGIGLKTGSPVFS